MERTRLALGCARGLRAALFLFACSVASAQQTPPTPVFSVTLPGSGSEGIAIAADAAGNSYVASSVLLPNSSIVLRAAKLSSSGGAQWSVDYQNTSSHDTDPQAVAVDTAGFSYWAGNDFTAGTSFIVKRDSVGLFVSSRTLQGASFSEVGGIAFDPSSGHLYAAGNAGGIFVAEYDRNLVQLNSQTVSGSFVSWIASDQAGNVYVLVNDNRIVKFRPHLIGTPLYNKPVGSSGSAFLGLAVDPPGNAYAAGVGGVQGFLVKLAPNGSLQGTATFQTPPTGSNESIEDIFTGASADAGGNVYSADFGRIIQFDPITSGETETTFLKLVKFDPQLREQWDVTPFTGVLTSNAAGLGSGTVVVGLFLGSNLAVDSQNSVYATGTLASGTNGPGGFSEQTIVAKYSQASGLTLSISTGDAQIDRKSTRLNSSHSQISY